jgi:two-component system invasion response regulator UvrY
MSSVIPIKVYLVDDHPVVRDGYRRLLESSPGIKVVAEASSGEEVCADYSEVNPDIVVLDLNMPGIGGMETIRRLLVKDPNARILVFSMHDSETMVTRALEAGAFGYLNKSSVASQMVDAVKMVSEGKRFLNHNLAPKVLENHLRGNDPLQVLTEREFQVFRQLAEGMSVQEIATTLSISPKTVGVHQTHIMKKLRLRNSAELTRMAIRYGVIPP